MELVTIPSFDRLMLAGESCPDYMRPSSVPTAVVARGYLSMSEIEAIEKYMSTSERYSFRHCDAITSEAPRPLDRVFDPIMSAAREINNFYFGFDLDEECAAWMQTYNKGDFYQRHIDDAPGQTRKLTAVAMLSSPSDYTGGDLRVVVEPVEHVVSKAQGTVVVFPSWVPHLVNKVHTGVRKTINLGFWGPPFK